MTNQHPALTLRLAQIIITVLALAVGSSHGFTVQTTHTYGDYEGATVTYLNVRESTATEAPLEDDNDGTALVVSSVSDPTVLYGYPTITGDILSFEDPSFSSLAGTSAVGPADVTDGRLSFSLHTNASMFIEFLTLDEFGLVSLTSTNPAANAGTLARIQAPAFLTVNEVMLDDGSTLALPIATRLVTQLQVTPTETVQNGGWDADSPPVDSNGNPTSAWEGRVTFDIVNMLAANGITAPEGRLIVGATKLDYDMNNTLTTIAQVGDSTAVIDKKGINIFPDITPMQVPEPGAVFLFALGSAAVGLIRRRRSN